ncbi:MAG: hypothetical protein ACPG8W_25405 [Candidatus Promineifilaceae bacterium]
MRRSNLAIRRSSSITANLFSQLNQVVAQHHSPLGQIARENLATNFDDRSAEIKLDTANFFLFKSV